MKKVVDYSKGPYPYRIKCKGVPILQILLMSNSHRYILEVGIENFKLFILSQIRTFMYLCAYVNVLV